MAIIRVTVAPRLEAPRPIVEVAEVIPDVDTIQVDMLGTVNIVKPPIKKVTMTIPKDKIPLEANQPNFSIEFPAEVSSNCWKRVISASIANC